MKVFVILMPDLTLYPTGFLSEEAAATEAANIALDLEDPEEDAQAGMALCQVCAVEVAT